MKATSQESGVEGRIVIVSSDSYKMTYRGGIQFDSINNEQRFAFFFFFLRVKIFTLQTKDTISFPSFFKRGPNYLLVTFLSLNKIEMRCAFGQFGCNC
jgi:hypothetical protein